MPGNFDDIILDVLNAKRGQTDPNVPLWKYPDPRAQVPPDTMRDTPYDVLVDPGAPYDETNMPVAANKNVAANEQQRRNVQLDNLPGDLGALVGGMERRQRLGRNK